MLNYYTLNNLEHNTINANCALSYTLHCHLYKGAVKCPWSGFCLPLQAQWLKPLLFYLVYVAYWCHLSPKTNWVLLETFLWRSEQFFIIPSPWHDTYTWHIHDTWRIMYKMQPWCMALGTWVYHLSNHYMSKLIYQSVTQSNTIEIKYNYIYEGQVKWEHCVLSLFVLNVDDFCLMVKFWQHFTFYPS